MSAKRINITIDEDAADKLLELAGSERKQGEMVSELVRAEWQRRNTGIVMLAQRVEELEKEVKSLRKALGQA